MLRRSHVLDFLFGFVRFGLITVLDVKPVQDAMIDGREDQAGDGEEQKPRDNRIDRGEDLAADGMKAA